MSLAARNVSFSYPGGRPLFDGLSLAVEPGERVAILAPSGAGKTTLLRLLAGYLRPHVGSIEVDGEPLDAVPVGRPRPVQLVWQHPEQALDPRLRIERSLREAGEVRGARMQGLLGRLGVREEWLPRYPHELSGGELMRICLVRALAPRPRYILLDEATAMLDALTQAQLMRAVVDIADKDGAGIALVSHSPALVRRVATREVRL